MKRSNRQGLAIALAILLLVGGVLLSWLTHGRGVVRDDPKRNISVPKTLTVPLQVRAAYNAEKIFVNYRWPADRPGLFHDVLVYEGGRWVVKGRATPGSQPDGMHEDRVAMMLDDGGVPEFARYGGYITVGDGILTFTNEASEDAVKAHPYLGGKLKQEEVSKSLPGTRSDINDWASLRSEEVLGAQRRAGYFLDLWHWRSHRANPIGMSDDQMVAEVRGGDDGKSAAGTNWDGERQQPRLMFDAAAVGHKALQWADVVAGRIDQESVYYLVEGQAVPFDPQAGWVEGDTLPRRFLRQPEGSKADITVQGKGRWADGHWDVTLSRALDTGHPLDDKILRDHRGHRHGRSPGRAAAGRLLLPEVPSHQRRDPGRQHRRCAGGLRRGHALRGERRRPWPLSTTDASGRARRATEGGLQLCRLHQHCRFQQDQCRERHHFQRHQRRRPEGARDHSAHQPGHEWRLRLDQR